MRLNLHDFSGHPFQAQLSRSLARRGHEVVHSYSAQYITGHGRLSVDTGDPATLRMEPITADAPMIKYSPMGRTRFELAYANAWRTQLDAELFDLVIACNVPLIAMARMRRYFARHNQPWVFWHQDIYSAAMATELTNRLPGVLARPAASFFGRMEKAVVRDAGAVVAIGEPFVQQYERWGLRTDHVSVIANWAPLDELVPGQRDNDWSARQELLEVPIRLMYAGTLGRKHNPLLLLRLLDEAKARGVDASLLVISEGVGADDLAAAAVGRADVRIFGYQPAVELPDVLASADVVVALLEPDAAQFSVPSKVWSYLSAGRPIIALVPDGNPCAAEVSLAGGCVAPPSNAGCHVAAQWLAEVAKDPEGLIALGKRARAVAEERFDIDQITDAFEDLLNGVYNRNVENGPTRPAANGYPRGGLVA